MKATKPDWCSNSVTFISVSLHPSLNSAAILWQRKPFQNSVSDLGATDLFYCEKKKRGEKEVISKVKLN